MENLLKGVGRFKREDFEAYKRHFSDISHSHKPHTLIIACCDARVDLNLITKAPPGELYFVRNVANIVPPCRDTDEFVATTAAIEYAVMALEVKDIIICGHSNCGGCAASLNNDTGPDTLPHTRRWLELLEPVRRQVCVQSAEMPEAREWMMEQANVISQIGNLLTYPYILEKLNAGTLRVHGWYYIIETGEIFVYDNESGQFHPAESFKTDYKYIKTKVTANEVGRTFKSLHKKLVRKIAKQITITPSSQKSAGSARNGF
jgi:carbonic anhydrase